MSKLKIWLLTLIMMCSMLPSIPAYADNSLSWDHELMFDTAYANSSMDIWGNYGFVAHSKGITIVDLQNGKTKAEWKLDKTAVPGLSSFVPLKIEVNDEYILISKADAVLVFPNTGAYTDTPPAIIRRLGKFASVTKATVNGDYLYIFDKTANGTVTGIKANNILVWKIALQDLDSLKANGSAANKYSIVANCTNVERLNLGVHEGIWSDIIVEDNTAYVTVFNNTSAEPYKTLYLEAVDLETFSEDAVAETDLYSGYLDALTVSFDTKEPVSEDWLRENMEVYLRGGEETKVMLSGLKKGVFLITVLPLTDGGSRVTINLTDLNAVAALFENVTAAELSGSQKVICTSIEENTYSFAKARATENYDDGNVKKSGNMIYFTTRFNGGGKPNYYISARLDGLTCESVFEPQVMGYYNSNQSGYIGTVLYGKNLGGIIYGNDNNFYGFSRDTGFDGSVSDNVTVKKGISSSNKFSDFITYGGRIYYLMSNNNGIGVLSAGGASDFSNAVPNGGKFPVVFYGASGSDEIPAGVAGDTLSIPVENGLFRFTVYSYGESSFNAAVNGEELTITAASAPIAEITAADDTKFTVKNNSALYGRNNKSFIISEAAYDAENKLLGYNETSADIANDDEKDISLTARENAVKRTVNIFTAKRQPLLSYDITADGIKLLSTRTALGEVNEIECFDVKYDYSKDIAIISGKTDNKSERAVSVTIMKNDAPVFSGIANTDNNGEFLMEYFYGDETPALDDVYRAEISAAFSNAAQTKEFSLINSAEVNEKLDNVIKNASTGADLRNMLSQDEEIVKLLGIDLSNEDYKALSEESKNSVMQVVLEDIKQNKTAEIQKDFAAESSKKRSEEITAQALKEVNSAKASTLTGILNKYRKEFEITDELWTKYNGMGSKVSDVNTEFLNKGSVSAASEIAARLDSSITTVKNRKTDSSTPSKGNGSSSTRGNGSAGTSKSTSYTMTETPPGQKDEPKKIEFTDVDDSHWAKAAIDELADKGIISGMNDGTFCPNDDVTREQFIKMLVTAIGDELGENLKSTFTDVDDNAWYYPYVAKAEKIGLAKGSDGRFGIGEKITRQDACVFLARVAEYMKLKLEETDKTAEFSDNDEISDYALDAVYAMQSNGIINGMDNNRFESAKPCTRAMAAKMIYGLLQLGKNE